MSDLNIPLSVQMRDWHMLNRPSDARSYVGAVEALEAELAATQSAACRMREAIEAKSQRWMPDLVEDDEQVMFHRCLTCGASPAETRCMCFDFSTVLAASGLCRHESEVKRLRAVCVEQANRMEALPENWDFPGMGYDSAELYDACHRLRTAAEGRKA